MPLNRRIFSPPKLTERQVALAVDCVRRCRGEERISIPADELAFLEATLAIPFLNGRTHEQAVLYARTLIAGPRKSLPIEDEAEDREEGVK